MIGIDIDEIECAALPGAKRLRMSTVVPLIFSSRLERETVLRSKRSLARAFANQSTAVILALGNSQPAKTTRRSIWANSPND